MVRQVEIQTPEDMATKFVRNSSARPPPHMRAWKVGTMKATTQTTVTQDEVATVKKSNCQSPESADGSAESSSTGTVGHSVRDRVLHKASGRHSAGWNRQRILQQTGKTSLPLVSPTCSLRVESSNETNKPHSSRSSRRQPAKPQQSLYQGPNARKEAEETERTKWIELLGSMLAHTPTPIIGTLLAAQPSNLQLLGAGRRAATLRSRVRAVKRFLDWLAVSDAKGYPTELHDNTGYLQGRQSEPCTRGALKGAHKALVFMEEVAGVTAQARITTSSLYLVLQKELLANSIPGRPPKQASRMFMSMLAALEELTVDDKALPYYRVYAWWILLQSWGMMRFSDHRGLKPSDVQVTGNTMSAKLTRSKNDR